MEYSKEITVDLSGEMPLEYITAVQGDTARKIRITLLANNQPYEIPKDSNAVFRAEKPDGTGVFNNCTINDDFTVTAELTVQTLAVCGNVRCQITLYGADDSILTSVPFIVKVIRKNAEDSKIESTNEFNAIKDAAEMARSAYEQATKALNVEAASIMKICCDTYKWYVNSEANPQIDQVYKLTNGEWTPTGKTLKQFESNEYIGVWFYVGDGKNNAGMTRYKLIADGYTNTGYQIDGADGYLNCRDYVIWLGRWVRFNVYEAKASTVKNSDGQYSPKSGVCGLMSSTDKAYLTDLVNRFIASNQKSAYNSGNDCAESGLYGHINSGRPTGSELFNLISVKDKNNNITSQLAVGQDSGQLWSRGKVSDNWKRHLTDKDLITQLGVSEDTAAWTNWLTQPGIYKVTIRSDDSACPPTTDGRDFVFIVMPGAPNATTQTAVTQIAINRRTRAVHLRYAAGYTGSGSLASTASAWVTVADGLNVNGKADEKIGTLADLKTTAKENVVAAVNEVKAEAGTAVKIRGSLNASETISSDDVNYNGQAIDTSPNIKKGDAFTVSENQTSWWDRIPPKAGDMIISIGDNPSLPDNWLILPGAEATSALESRIAAIEKQLNGIRFEVDTNGHLVYEWTEEATK